MSWDLIEHFKLDAEIQGDHTIQIEHVSDPRRGLRKVRVEKRWIWSTNLGHGAFGDVWLEVQKEQDNVIAERAVKAIKKRRMQNLDIDYKRELLALAKLSRHQDLFVTLYGWYENEENVFLAMEYYKHGDLGHHLQNTISESDAKEITTQLLEGLSTMHDMGFTHRDLKPQNIFVVQPAPEWWVKIGDFGISKRISLEQTALRTQAGTQQFQAPEILGFVEESEETSEYTSLVDIWSLACVIHLILTNKPPFANARALIRYCDTGFPFLSTLLSEKGISRDGCDFIGELLCPSPSRRPTAQEALGRKYLRPFPTPPAPPPRKQDKTHHVQVSKQASPSILYGSVSFDQFGKEIPPFPSLETASPPPGPPQTLPERPADDPTAYFRPGNTSTMVQSTSVQPMPPGTPAKIEALVPDRPVFGKSLTELFARDGVAVPYVVVKCIEAVDRFGLQEDGIYTKHGLDVVRKKLRQRFDHDSHRLDLTKIANFDGDIAAVADILKQFLLELEDPLLTRAAHVVLIQAAKIGDDLVRRDSIHAIINALPDAHYATVRVLAFHLSRVTKNSDAKSMSKSPLGVIFGSIWMGSSGDNAGLIWERRLMDMIVDHVYEIFDED